MHSRSPGEPAKLCCSVLNHHPRGTPVYPPRAARRAGGKGEGERVAEGEEWKSAREPGRSFFIFYSRFISPGRTRTEKRQRLVTRTLVHRVQRSLVQPMYRDAKTTATRTRDTIDISPLSTHGKTGREISIGTLTYTQLQRWLAISEIENY